jgi:hypothetical protein
MKLKTKNTRPASDSKRDIYHNILLSARMEMADIAIAI